MGVKLGLSCEGKFKNRLNRKISGLKSKAVIEGSSKPHKKEFEDCTSNVIMYIRSGRRRRVGHAAFGEEKRNAIRFWWGNLKQEDLSVEGDKMGVDLKETGSDGVD
jgi:hypothetical protein